MNNEINKELKNINYKKIKNIYLFRKIYLVLLLIFVLSGLALTIYSYFKYQNRIKAEYDFLLSSFTHRQWQDIIADGKFGSYVKSYEVKNAFYLFNSFSLIIFSTLLLLSLISIFLIFSNKGNAYRILNTMIILLFTEMIVMFFILAFQPFATSKEVQVTLNGNIINQRILMSPAKPDYSIYALLLILSTLFFASSFIAKSNHGFVTKDIYLTKPKKELIKKQV